MRCDGISNGTNLVMCQINVVPPPSSCKVQTSVSFCQNIQCNRSVFFTIINALAAELPTLCG